MRGVAAELLVSSRGWPKAFVAFIGLFGVLAMGACSPSVAMTSTRHPGFRGSVEPLVFVIFEMNTGSDYTVPLKKYLHAELRARKVQGRAAIITGAEFNEEAA